MVPKSGAGLPNDMSGLFLRHSSIESFIVVNFVHLRARKQLPCAHKYARALLDRQDSATVLLEENRRKFPEVRANAFTPAFLLPRTGVWLFLNSRFKAVQVSLSTVSVIQPLNRKLTRPGHLEEPRSQVLTLEFIAALAHHFEVSYQRAIFCLKSLSIVNESDFTELRGKQVFGKPYLHLLEFVVDTEEHDKRKPDRKIVSHVVHLALEAFRRDEISNGKLRDLSTLLNFSVTDLLMLAQAA